MDSVVTPIVVLNLMVVGAITSVIMGSKQPRGRARWADIIYSKAVAPESGRGTGKKLFAGSDATAVTNTSDKEPMSDSKGSPAAAPKTGDATPGDNK